MTDRTDAQAAIDALTAKAGMPDSVSPINLAADQLQVILDKSVMGDEEVTQISTPVLIGDDHELNIDAVTGRLTFYSTPAGVEEFIGEAGGGLTDQFLSTKAGGGFRVFNASTGFEEFFGHRDTCGDGNGVTFGSVTTNTGNTIATSANGGLTIYQLVNVQTRQQLGNPASVNYIESDFFTFDITSDQILPYGAMVRRFEGDTDVPFSDVYYDIRLLDSTGTELYSDIQNLAVWEEDPELANSPAYKLSSDGLNVAIPMPQQYPMNSGCTYKMELRLKTPIRLKGDGAQPALEAIGPRLEYYSVNYTEKVTHQTADFVALSGAHYKVEINGAPINATVHPTVQSVFVGDYAATFDNSNLFTLETIEGDPTGDVTFGTAAKGKQFEVIRDGATFRIYNADGSLRNVVP